MPADLTAMQKYHLDSRRHHPYCDVLINGTNEKKQYYQLNSKKHHAYQPDPKVYQKEQAQEPGPGPHGDVKAVSVEVEKVLDEVKEESKVNKESTRAVNGTNSKLKIVKNKNKNGRIVIVMSKYMENGKQADGGVKQNGTSENYPNRAVEKTQHLENGYHEDDRNGQVHRAGAEEFQNAETSQVIKKSDSGSSENSVLKRRHSEPSGDRRDAKSFLSCRSISTPNASSSPGQSNTPRLNGLHGSTCEISEACQDEPMDLSFTGSRGTRNAITDVRANGNSDTVEKDTAPSTREPEGTPSFTPFLGNIIITDVTTNCLTVTFKEYVPVSK